jgi:hypothetical protein
MARWGGRVRFEALVGGRHGGYVPLGDAAVPRRVRLTMEGANGAPDLKMLFELRDERPECIEVAVTTKPDGRGIAASDLQVLQRRLATLTAETFTRLAAKPFYRPRDGKFAGSYGSLPEDRRQRLERDLYEARASRRGDLTRTELEEVASVYREHLDASPTRAVSLLLGYSERTAARRVQRAREAGLLPKTTPGKRKA